MDAPIGAIDQWAGSFFAPYGAAPTTKGSGAIRNSQLGGSLATVITGHDSVNRQGVTMDGTTILPDKVHGDADSFYRSLVFGEPSPYTTNPVNAYASVGVQSVNAAATMATGFDPIYGVTKVVTCAASAASWGSNSYLLGATGATLGQYGYFAIAFKADKNCSIHGFITGSAGTGPDLAANITANTWYQLRICTSSLAAGNYFLGLWATDSSGPVFTIARPWVCFVGTTRDLASVFNANPGGGNFDTSTGTQVTAANTITPTGRTFHMTGATVVKTINLPWTGFTGPITIIPDSAYTTDATGNIYLASTAVVNKAMIMTYDGTKWSPSY